MEDERVDCFISYGQFEMKVAITKTMPAITNGVLINRQALVGAMFTL